eukprot:5278309-Pyramimonas_sp.AAC.1
MGLPPSLWEAAATHNDEWQYVMVFIGRVVARLRYRICRDGTLVTSGQARCNDISRIVQLSLIEETAQRTRQMGWAVIFLKNGLRMR